MEKHAFRFACAGTLAVEATGAMLGATVRGQSRSGFPARLYAFFNQEVKLSSDTQTRLLAGEPITQLLDTDPAKEVAIFGAIWINAPIARYVAGVKDIEEFEEGMQTALRIPKAQMEN
jgi:hypothetical protein